MRRDSRRKDKSSQMTLYTGIGVICLGIIVFALFMYNKNLNKDTKNSTLDIEKISAISENNTENTTMENTTTESASTDIGKTVEESANEINNTAKENETQNSSSNKTANTTRANTTSTRSNVNSNVSTNNNANAVSKTQSTEEKEETKKELSFEMPVNGEIVREYAKDNLIYSATLDEWTTHTGIDIKADKTSVVKAAEEGTVKTIKNDPRYGLTVVIEHENGFQTVYSNLLTSEFVVEGEEVEKGQSIGTVGNTAVFEIADEPHLHFEILKDSMPEDPGIYIVH